MRAGARPNKTAGAAIGVAMFRADQWDRLRATVADPQVLEATHAAWHRTVTASLAAMRQRGLDVREVPVDVEQLATWCRTKNLPNTQANRALYAAETIQAQDAAEDDGEDAPAPAPPGPAAPPTTPPTAPRR